MQSREMPPPPHSFLSQQSNSNNSFYPSLLIIALLLILVFLISFSIHLFLLFLDRIRSSSPRPLDHPPSDLHVSSSKPLIHSLPLFSFDSAVTAPDCAVCLSRFDPRDQLRLLPVCGHAFHSRCIDTWLAFNRTCPLCRSTIQVDESPPSAGEESFRVDNVVDDDDVEAQIVVGPAGGVAEFAESAKEDAPGADVAEAIGGGMGWLKEYLDRLASSASSSALSLRLSGRSGGHGFAGIGRRSDGVEGNAGMSWDMDMAGEDGSYFFRWWMGA